MSEAITRRALIAGGAALAMLPMPSSVDALWTHDRPNLAPRGLGRWVRPYRGGVVMVHDGFGWLPSDYEALFQLAARREKGAWLERGLPGRWAIKAPYGTGACAMAIAASDRATEEGRGTALDCAWLCTPQGSNVA